MRCNVDWYISDNTYEKLVLYFRVVQNIGDSAYVARKNSVQYNILYLYTMPIFKVNTVSIAM